ncbi:MAG: protocatechuate 3,4-dioxygenase subunit alpha [Candidatus Binatales bacterium]
MPPGQTPSQTIGPFFGPALIWPGTEILVRAKTRGERIVIEGRVLDGDGAPVGDAMIEIWQANAEGRYDHPDDSQQKQLDPDFHGFGRVATDSSGGYRLRTIRPGAVAARDAGLQAPHINVAVFARGLLKHLVTRIYFPNEPLNADDPILKAVPPDRRPTLVAIENAAEPGFRFDIVLQGDNETVFFSV